MANLPLSCIIGAGSSGITTAKALKDRDLPFDCFEQGDNVGGVWYYRHPSGHSAAYRSLHINTSKQIMEFEDFPMPQEYPVYCGHEEIFRYFNAYVDHFQLRERITFNTAVKHAVRGEDGVWQVTLGTGETRFYDCLFVCNGHHWDPSYPDPPIPGHFNGITMHAHEYRTPEFLIGKRVVLLGIGNSAMDISVESSYLAEKVIIAARSGVHILPKYIMGVPTDHLIKPWVPQMLAQPIFELLLRWQVGRPEDFGMPRPNHRLLQSHPTISSTFLDRLGHGAITIKPNISRLDGDGVVFADGTREKADVLIYCTGYKVSFPFFDPDFIAAPGNDLPLYRRMIRPGLDNLFFIGLFQPLGAIFPLAEVQARIAGEYLLGRCAFPTVDEMRLEMERERAAMFRRYVASRRHTMQVDFYPFMKQLRRELRRGAVRARAAGNRLPVPARAWSRNTACMAAVHGG